MANDSRAGRNISRRRFVQVSAAATALTGTGLSAPYVLASDEPIKVGAWGGFYEETLSKQVYPEFTKATGIEIESIGTPIGDAQVVQLSQSIRAGQVPMDVSAQIPIPMIRAANAEVFDPIDESKLPNASAVDAADPFYRNADGVPLGSTWANYFIVLVALKKYFPVEPDSWGTLWQKEAHGQAALMAQPDVSNIIDIAAATFFGGQEVLRTKDGVLQVLEKISELAKNVKLWYRDEAQFQSGLETGDLPIGLYYNDVATVAQDQGIKMHRTFPKEGAPKNPITWAITKGTPATDRVHEFINYTLTADVQTLLARELGSGPALPRDKLSLNDEEWDRVSTGGKVITPEYRLYTDWGDWTSTEFSKAISA